MSSRAVASAALVATAAGAVLLLALLALGRDQPDDDVVTLPAPVQPAFTIPRPMPIVSPGHASRWASVLRPVAVRAASRRAARVVATLEATTPEGTGNLVLVLENAVSDGQVWARVRLPVLPNNSTGWVPRRALGGYRVVQTRLVVDRDLLEATLLRNGKPVFRAPVGIGKASWPTPAGEFYVRNRVRGFKSAFYGPLAFGTSARSSVLTDWPAGGFVGIHGTNRPDLVPGQISHGCIRMRNQDILELGRLMPVGTPLTII